MKEWLLNPCLLQNLEWYWRYCIEMKSRHFCQLVLPKLLEWIFTICPFVSFMICENLTWCIFKVRIQWPSNDRKIIPMKTSFKVSLMYTHCQDRYMMKDKSTQKVQHQCHSEHLSKLSSRRGQDSKYEVGICRLLRLFFNKKSIGNQMKSNVWAMRVGAIAVCISNGLKRGIHVVEGQIFVIPRWRSERRQNTCY